ncbi:hypothetical protein BDR05DRAFT_305519 [Suillus weaverae]|nr:hypothetical protein BDR05DRAFT_305519 [Suillus weaverae]
MQKVLRRYLRMCKRSLCVFEVADEPSVQSLAIRRASGWELKKLDTRAFKPSFKVKRSVLHSETSQAACMTCRKCGWGAHVQLCDRPSLRQDVHTCHRASEE